MFDIFTTLISKTFFVLAISLSFCYFGAQAVLSYFRKLKNSGSPLVSAVYNEQGQEDLIVDPCLIKKPFWISLGVMFALIIVLCNARDNLAICIPAMLGFTFSSGVSLGINLIVRDENLGIQVTQLTTLAVLLTSFIGMYSGVNFGFLEKYLLIGLIILIVAGIVRIFVRISGTARKMWATFGIAVFIGYLLYDFNRLAKFSDVEMLNTWNSAIRFALSIYLDIINLFLQILDLLSGNN